ncbi:bifunctional DNA-formamidopyrimidine glycosylase/DNA-(apurinic or apyrimidinic site) lyase [Ancylobacter sp. TS-1]|uniref:bifunctional DNA-formamidopyrimidine glycosylase/DNA-(apurinic or apyrimidinic site) lyase n=1 Tax=Ancylobacter sp. TS-1 TaxID=1850374 RepID=UPI001265CD22|nr:bifunctional DNA-formamidopyrimidine glycosylase/DNA-(apurinic or apyrimidinic site) lyase [Ancylobacter sp. TS-1]QFR31622.1 bifunctional DNA-formamidopyrimidine glycosylase/DNA-(apurinic or apyrimidinic site) lyase [Ancylobacter sp. TS-1]
MPELPEVETVRRGLAPVMEGRRILAALARRPDLRWPLPERFAERLTGRTLRRLDRRAKYLMADVGPDASGVDEVLVMHLGMSGSFRIEPDSGPPEIPGDFHMPHSRLAAHDHVVLRMEGGAGGGVEVVYNDPRRFGAMLLVPRDGLAAHPLFRDLGPEPLGADFTPEALARALAGRRTPLKAALLDQKIVAGLGNIYVCEALHRAGLSPERPAGTLVTAAGRPTAAARRLVETIRLVLEEAIAAGGSTLRDHAQVDGTLGYFQHTFRAYDREGEPCLAPGCRGTIARLVQSGRSTFYCIACQR